MVFAQPRISTPAFFILLMIAGRNVFATSWCTSMVSMALHVSRPLDLGVEADLLGHGKVGLAVHVHMADALVMLDHRYGGVLRDHADQPFAAAGDDEIDDTD